MYIMTEEIAQPTWRQSTMTLRRVGLGEYMYICDVTTAKLKSDEHTVNYTMAV